MKKKGKEEKKRKEKKEKYEKEKRDKIMSLLGKAQPKTCSVQ